MTELVFKTGRQALAWAGLKWPANGWRLVVLALLTTLALSGPEVRDIVFGAISEAYLQVTVFVATTLALVYTFETRFRFDLGEAMARARWYQAPIAAALGALPGCGGAIIVVTQYTRGLVSFGSVVSVLIATMGDAAFLLIAREPMTGLGVMALGFTVGSLSGWIVDAIHGQAFMRPSRAVVETPSCDMPAAQADEDGPPLLTRLSQKLWGYLIVPGLVLGLFVAAQAESDWLFGPLSGFEPTHWFGAAAGILCLVMWGLGRNEKAYVAQHARELGGMSLGSRVIKDTNFVTSWVVLGFLTYELGVHLAGSGIDTWLQVWAPVVPLVAVLVGFIPGCGPQIVVTTLYLSGAIPLSAQLGNAIANDGDALFPALALAPRAAVLATIYSALPAFVVAYVWFLAFE